MIPIAAILGLLASLASAAASGNLPPDTKSAAATSFRLHVVDANGDGLADKLRSFADGTLALSLNNGDGTFRPLAQDLPRVHVNAVLSSDLDGDGETDLYLVTPGENVVLRGLPGGWLAVEEDALGLADAGHGLAARRLDMDGIGGEELLLTNVSGDVLFWERSGRFERDPESSASSLDGAEHPIAAGEPDGRNLREEPGQFVTGSSTASSGGGASSTSAVQRILAPGLQVAPHFAASSTGVLDARYVNDDAGEVDSADIADGSLTGADVSTNSGDVVFLNGRVGVGKAPEWPLDVDGRIECAYLRIKDTSTNSPNSPLLVLRSESTHPGADARLLFTVKDPTHVDRTGELIAHHHDGNDIQFTFRVNDGGVQKDALTIRPTGWVRVYGGLTADERITCSSLRITGGSDLVEGFEAFGAPCPPGTVVSVDAERPGGVRLSSRAYDRCVVGVVSGAGGVDHGLRLGQDGVLDGDTLVAMTGRVWVRCIDEGGPIAPGDLLTTSSTPGHAMRATDPERWDGAVIGKAMSPLADGTGLVLVLVNLQ